ncbi:MAG: response regulator [Sporomusaceae bacterium]|nr:response regulator [Sporomusaceae bacterium]
MSEVKTRNSVLFVDDEQQILNSIRRATEDEPFKSLFANSGKEALRLLEEQAVSVIVTDMRMPEMDGLSLLKTVREKYPKTVRIVLSGYTQLSQVLATVNHGDIFQFIPKPWSMEDELLVTVRQAIEHYNLEAERERLKEGLVQKNTAYQNMFRTMEQTLAKERRDLNQLKQINTWIFSFLKKFSSGKETGPEGRALFAEYSDLLEKLLGTYIDLLPLGSETKPKDLFWSELLKQGEEVFLAGDMPELPEKVVGYHELLRFFLASILTLLGVLDTQLAMVSVTADRKNVEVPILIFDITGPKLLASPEQNLLKIGCSLLNEMGKAYNFNVRLKQEELEKSSVRLVWAVPEEKK